ncbi:MAG: electron transfer flavoprotein subunit beta/FixA family protein [Solirubrobacterales bacterium]
MHMLVCVKQVPDTTEIKMNPKTNTLDRSSASTIINPYDAHAVEEAVRIKNKYGGRVTVLSMGPPQAQEVIKKCIEMGADDGYLLSDRAFSGSDTLATSYILAMGIDKIVQEEAVDIVFCGKQAIDGDTAQVGPGIASRLGMDQLTYVEKIQDLDVKNRNIIVHRKNDAGHEVVQASIPCLITVEKDINELSYSSLPNMIKAARYKAKIWGINDFNADMDQLGLKGSATSVRKIFPPLQRPGGELLKGNTNEVVKVLVEKLKGGLFLCQQ